MKVLNYGSLNIDKVYTVDHFVVAGETTAALHYQEFCGGKGLNQSIAMSRAGMKVYHAGKIGTDGIKLKELLQDSNVDTSYVTVTNEQNTGHAVIQIDKNGQNCILLYGGANQEITPVEIEAVLADFGYGDIVVLQNEVNNLKYVIDAAFEKGMILVLNPSPMDGRLCEIDLRKIGYLILNEIEGEQLTGKRDPGDIVDSLLQAYPTIKLVLTLGSQGVLYADCSKRCRQGIFHVPVADTTAAGDTFLGYFVREICLHAEPETAIRNASAASALAVSVKGASTSIPYYDSVQKFLETASSGDCF